VEVLISHSFAADDILATSLEKGLRYAGFKPVDIREFGEHLQRNFAGGSDRVDLDNAFRLAGYRKSMQERSDPNLLIKLVDILREIDIILVLWSAEFTRRYWTRIEWTTAMSMCKHIAVLQLDGTPLSPSLARAVARGTVPSIPLNADYRTATVANALLSMCDTASGRAGVSRGEVRDFETGLDFVVLEHPSLGTLEIAKYPTTRREAAELGSNLFKSPEALSTYDDHPLASITWHEAVEVCRRMSANRSDQEFRLASEVEWEFAARAGELTSTGVPLDQVDRFGVFNQLSSLPVGTKEPNAWGLYDMAGNVAEWTADAGDLTEVNGWVQPVPKHDPSEGGDRAHIVRGGWYGQARFVSLSHRFPQRNEQAEAAVGMRVVRCPRIRSEADSELRGARCPES
jgi:hypothetical protein